MVNAFALAVNAIHTQGQGTTALAPGTGIPFFVNGSGGTSQFKMSDLALNSAIQGTAGLGNIATGLIDPLVSIGDNAIALQIANLAHGWSSLVSLPGGMAPGVQESSSLMDYYRSCVSALGVKVQEAERMTKGQEILLNNATNQRERISGVSLDEEMTNLIRFQRSYNAAARIVTTVDSMLEAILGMGLTR